MYEHRGLCLYCDCIFFCFDDILRKKYSDCYHNAPCFIKEIHKPETFIFNSTEINPKLYEYKLR